MRGSNSKGSIHQFKIGGLLGRIRKLEQRGRALLEEAWSFRGSGELPSGVLDEAEAGPARVKVYDLFGLLANFDLTLIDEVEFYDEIARWGLPRRAYERQNLVSYCRVRRVLPERNDVGVVFNQDLATWGEDEFGVAQVVERLEADAPGVAGLVTLNRRITRRKMVALLCLLHPAELARRLRLPQPFPVYRFVSRDGYEGSICFGRQALLVETALHSRPDIHCGGGAMIV